MGSLIVLLLIGGIVAYIWYIASFNHRARRQQRQVLELQRMYIELAHRQAGVAERTLARDEKALELAEIEQKWHDSDYRGMT